MHHRRRHTATLATAGIAALIGTGMFAAPASAHTPTWSVDCSTVSVNLTSYSEKPTNTVTITADGKELLSESFGGGFKKELKLPAHDEKLPVKLVVKANDGDQHNVDETKTAPVCEEESPEPTPPTSPPAESPSPSEPAESPSEPTAAPSTSMPAESPSAEAPSSSAPAAAKPAGSSSPAPADLAETGSSSSTPMIAGIAAAVVAAGGALLLVARKRRAAQD
ncbi:LPXTG cell wall anchor domain-containing protein [Streptomyces sp. N2-109]|uniref:LPXTG cell wall anchor domain-containing protein n=1 Tax=Streptomyces gossypii TaxID=2883101 RepID=A0ABT2K103_9ACTN|nr:LPXTG cell wall anchor domain-containing protein [Streptomyces gossypii]